ncbi:MAG TPA: hypothetical protein VGQ42_16945 [Candidatus Dormibacteraeota bacterium]|nr:hypothetical protein [Candidatus Dormibacteraeota bacterium]
MVTAAVVSTSDGGGKARPGTEATFKVDVVNAGPGQATGVTVRVDLPASFRYQSTLSVNDPSGSVTRTQPSDPVVASAEPLWGQWSLGAPGVDSNGAPLRSTLEITFTVKANGKPADYRLTPHVFSDGGDEVVGKEAAVVMLAASDLGMTIAADESTAKRGDLVHYRVTVLNRGSGQAKGVGILVTLPGSIAFNKTESVTGNFQRADPVDPIAGALIVYYGGWVLPAGSEGRPGAMSIVFTGKVLATAQGGRYPVTAQLTNADGAVISLGDSAPVVISAPTPSPSPSGSPSPTARPAATPKPTSTPEPTPTPKPAPTPTKKP